MDTPGDREDMVIDAPGSPLLHTLRVNVVAIGSPLEDFVSKQNILQWALLLNTLTTFGGDVDPMDAVVVLRMPASMEDGLELDQAIFKHFKGRVSPDRFNFKGGVEASVWYRSVKKGYTLTSGKEVVHRVVKVRSFIRLSSLAVVWPPPVTCGIEDGCSYLWYFELNLACNERAALESLVKEIAMKKGHGYAFCAVCGIFVCSMAYMWVDGYSEAEQVDGTTHSQVVLVPCKVFGGPPVISRLGHCCPQRGGGVGKVCSWRLGVARVEVLHLLAISPLHKV